MRALGEMASGERSGRLAVDTGRKTSSSSTTGLESTGSWHPQTPFGHNRAEALTSICTPKSTAMLVDFSLFPTAIVFSQATRHGLQLSTDAPCRLGLPLTTPTRSSRVRLPTYSRKALHLTPSTISRPHLCGNASLRQMHPRRIRRRGPCRAGILQ